MSLKDLDIDRLLLKGSENICYTNIHKKADIAILLSKQTSRNITRDRTFNNDKSFNLLKIKNSKFICTINRALKYIKQKLTATERNRYMCNNQRL